MGEVLSPLPAAADLPPVAVVDSADRQNAYGLDNRLIKATLERMVVGLARPEHDAAALIPLPGRLPPSEQSSAARVHAADASGRAL